MEAEGSLPWSQQPYTGPYPNPDKSKPTTSLYLFNIHFNINLPPMSRSS
jgi:hypothetical protein